MSFRVHPGLVWLIASAALLGVLIALLPWSRGGESLIVQCAASQRGPVAEIAAAFEAETGHRVEVRYGASETILSNIAITGQGDVFLPADESYIEEARGRGLVAETKPLARMVAVLVVPAGNRRDVQTWNDLFVKQLKIAQANPDAAAIGRLTRERLQSDGRWAALHARTIVYKGNVVDVANAVAIGAVEAGVVWDVVGRMNPKLTVVMMPELSAVEARVTVAVLRSSPRPSIARDFVRYLANPERGGACFRRHGFDRFDSTDRAAPGADR